MAPFLLVTLALVDGLVPASLPRLVETSACTRRMMRLDGVNLFIRSQRPGESVNGDGADTRYTYDHFGVVVQDLNAAVDELRANGVVILEEPRTVRPGTHVAFVEGPDHTRIEVLQRDLPVGA